MKLFFKSSLILIVSSQENGFSMRRSRGPQPNKNIFFINPTKENESCPDLELFEGCETDCTFNFVGCQELCGDEFECLSSCQRQYVQCSESCPCNKDCFNGCYKCENAVCENCSVSTSEGTNFRRK